MAPKKQTTKKEKPEGIDGYSSCHDGGFSDIHEFKNEGEVLKGEYKGTKILPSKYSKDGSILWMVKKEDGELILVNEKTTMQSVRIEKLKEGMDIAIRYNGWKEGKNNQYKDFEVFIKDIPF